MGQQELQQDQLRPSKRATGPSSVTGASIGKAATAMEHPDQLGTERKSGPDDEEEEKLKKKIWLP